MSATVIIPARYASTRLPGKPLLAETGRPMIIHVIEAVKKAKLPHRLVVATDHEQIFQAVTDAGYDAVMTRDDHPNGTSRLAEAAEKLGLEDHELVVNVQGDEPEMPGELIDTLIEAIQHDGTEMATLAVPLPVGKTDDPNKVKVVISQTGKALYFSRSKIPYDRDGDGNANYYLHLGIYAYRVGFLKRYAAMPPTPAEQAEKLEQLRALETGHEISIRVVKHTAGGIDTPEDYAEFVSRVKDQ